MLKKRLGKKGFTLVEIIVVLVILAILAAIMVPSMVKWIDKAQEKSAVVAGRTALLALQTNASEHYKNGATAIVLSEVNDLMDLTEMVISETSIVLDGAQVTAFTAVYNAKYTVSYAKATGFTIIPV